MEPIEPQPAWYVIRIQARLSPDRAAWFDDMTITPVGPDETLLSGPLPDQAALHGVLAKIRDLGLPLLSVQQEPDR